MENTEVEQEHPWQHQVEEEEEEEMEEGLLSRTKNYHQTSIGVTNGEDLYQEKVKDLSQQNGGKVEEDEKQKETQEISEYYVYYDTSKGAELHLSSSATEAKSVESTANPVQDNINVIGHIQDDRNGVTNQNGEHHDNVSDSSLQSSEISFEAIKDGVNEITEYDVETVLKKQDTHDLYCPNCNSCITKRVILRKRKRKVPAPSEDAKRNKPEALVPSEVIVVSNDSRNDRARGGEDGLDVVQPPSSNEFDRQREPDVFRCLSCFSIFMPTGDGFKLFRMFGNKSNEENNQPSQRETPVKKRWFSSIFRSDKAEQLNNQGTVGSLNMENNVAGVSTISSNLDELKARGSPRQESSTRATNGSMNLKNEPVVNYDPASSSHEPNGHILENGRVRSPNPSGSRDDCAPSSIQGFVTGQLSVEESNNTIEDGNGKIATDSLVADTHDQILTSYHVDPNGKHDYPGTYVVPPPVNNVGSVENPISPLQHDGLKLLVPPNVGSLIIDNSQMNQELDVTIQMNSPIKSTSMVPNISHQPTIQNHAEIHLEEPLKVEKDVLTSEQVKLFEDLKDIERIKGKDAIITIGNMQPEASLGQRSPETLGETGSPALQDLEGGSHAVEQGGSTTLTGGRSLDIVKSIVYGGLMESIASLSVVSSAAGADAATLNVLALGLANIFGGLFVITHDIWDLKNECKKDEAPEKEDRYRQLLGQRVDFPLHVVVSLLSYLVFGFIPPIVFGFSFRESNDRDLKLLMMVAVSFTCIVTLAAGKAFVERPRKSYLKTIAYYVVFTFMVSGASYLFGDLIMKLLEKVDIFHSGSGSGLNMSIVDGARLTSALATY